MGDEGRAGIDRDGCRTIGEVAEALKVPQHVLRFWETRFPEVSPIKRAGGRRSYRPEDVALLRAIRDLLYGEGYTIRGVQRLLRDQGAQAFGAEADAERGPPPPAAAAAPVLRQTAPRLEGAEVGLRAALAELVECRRILDRARSPG